jgi:hypothetical protein
VKAVGFRPADLPPTCCGFEHVGGQNLFGCQLSPSPRNKENVFRAIQELRKF